MYGGGVLGRRRAAAAGTGMVGSPFLAFSVKLATATLNDSNNSGGRDL
jgi:hypothetical protein